MIYQDRDNDFTIKTIVNLNNQQQSRLVLVSLCKGVKLVGKELYSTYVSQQICKAVPYDNIDY